MAFKPHNVKGKRRKSFWKDKAKRNTALIGGFIILLMAASGLSMWGSDEETQEQGYEYKGVTFVDVGTGWLANLPSGEQLMIASNPQRLENLTMVKAVNLANFNYLEKVYVTSNPEDDPRRAMAEFFQWIPIDTRKVPACSVDAIGCEEMPIKVCEDASMEYGIIEFKKANTTLVNFKNNCLLIQGDNLLHVVDKLILETKL